MVYASRALKHVRVQDEQQLRSVCERGRTERHSITEADSVPECVRVCAHVCEARHVIAADGERERE